MPKKVLLNDPVLNEFIFDWIFMASQEDKKRLSARQLRSIKTPKAAKRFAVSTTLDEKLEFYQKMGGAYAVLLFPNGLFTAKKAQELFAEYESLQPKDRVKYMLDNKVMAVTDRQVALLTNLMANACHNDTYLMNRDFYKIGVHALNWEEPEHALTEATKETLEYVRVLNKMIHNSIMGAKSLTVNKVSNDVDMNILQFLFTKNGNYVTKQVIDDRFRGYYKIATVTSAVKRLMEGLYIDRHPSSKEREYTLTSLGIEEVMAFIKRTMNQTLNF